MVWGFLSNSEEAALLETEEYQKKVAEAVRSGILAYLHIGSEENSQENAGAQ